MPKHHWDAACYDNNHAFVWQYGKSLLELLAPQPNEHILDLGCGTGHLTQQMAIAPTHAVGIDADPAMIQQAQHNYPHLQFSIADARNFEVDAPLDAVFSNAVLHWIQEPDAVMRSVYRALKPGGRFVAELGGKGNIEAIVSALYDALRRLGIADPEAINPWYFPSIGEYTTLLEQQGFDVTYAHLFDRPTPLKDGTSGMAIWLSTFANIFLAGLSADQQTQVVQAVSDRLRPHFYSENGWIADYRRLRIVAVKTQR